MALRTALIKLRNRSVASFNHPFSEPNLISQSSSSISPRTTAVEVDRDRSPRAYGTGLGVAYPPNATPEIEEQRKILKTTRPIRRDGFGRCLLERFARVEHPIRFWEFPHRTLPEVHLLDGSAGQISRETFLQTLTKGENIVGRLDLSMDRSDRLLPHGTA